MNFRQYKEKVIKNNVVEIAGTASQLIYDHEVLGEKFYKTYVQISRYSGTLDVIPAIISERLIDSEEKIEGKQIHIYGNFRSHNFYENGKRKTTIFAFARDIAFEEKKANSVLLDGYICKAPIYRKTPMGREIADVLLAVNRPYGKSDYIPCICWGRNARFALNFEVGDHIQIEGRIQSREYRKQISEGEYETRMAYEVSISKIELVEGTENEDHA